PLGREVDDVGGQPLRGDLERGPGAGGVLEEQVDHGAPAQGGQLLDRAVGEAGQLLGGVEDEQGVVAGEVGGREQVAVHLAASSSAGPSSTPSRPSVSSSSTWTVSRREVGMFLPT